MTVRPAARWHPQVTIGVGMFQAACPTPLASPALWPDLPGALPAALLLAIAIPAAILAYTLPPRLLVDVRQQVRGIWRQLPGVGLVATTSRGTFLRMRRILDPDVDGMTVAPPKTAQTGTLTRSTEHRT